MYMAPEIVNQQRYNSKVDVWALGVIAHILLTGAPPFYGKEKRDIFLSILNNQPNFGNRKNNLSNFAVRFVEQCLTKDQSMRPTMQEVLDHPWLDANTEAPQVSAEVIADITKNLTIFHKQNIFQTGVVSFMQGMIAGEDELKDYKAMFLMLDKSQDGYLSKEELRGGMSRVLGTLTA